MKIYFFPKKDAHLFFLYFLTQIEQKISKNLSDLFSFEFGVTTKCVSCGSKSHNKEKTNFISLEIDKTTSQSTLDKCFDLFKNEELIGGYNCNVCESKTTITRSVRLSTTPKILVLHFRRFEIGFTGVVKLGLLYEYG